MKKLLKTIYTAEMILISLVAVACYGRYNYYKGRISKAREREDGSAIVIRISDIEETN